MTKTLIIAYIFMFLSPRAQVGEAQSHFQAGNELYQQGQYLEALNKYQSAMGTGYTSAELYYNLGNTYYKLGDISHSILYLERAKKLAPNDQDIQFNLELANLQVVDKLLVPPPFILDRVFNSIKNMYPLYRMGVLTMVLYVVFFLLLVVYILIRQVTLKKVVKFTLIPLLVVLLLFSWMFIDRVYSDIHNQYAIVLVEKIDIKSSPSPDATDVFVLHEGVKVQITERSGDFVKIELPDGKIGWMRNDVLEVI